MLRFSNAVLAGLLMAFCAVVAREVPMKKAIPPLMDPIP